MGLNHEEARLFPYFIFSNVNERPSRDILFLIKLEEPHSCFWVTAEPRGTRKQLWLYPPQARDSTCRVAGVLPASLWSIVLFLFPSE